MVGSPCLLTFHAHPDDESSKGPATVARYHAAGVRTVLVCATGGEEGDILNPAMDRPEVRADLAAVRRSELERAAGVIGYDEVVMLGYRDSGMAGTPANENPSCFAQADLDEAVGSLVAVIRRVRPQVMVTYGEDHSGYPHPDHIRTHEVGLAAFSAAGDATAYPGAGPVWQPQKLYYTTWSRTRMLATHAKFLELGMESPFTEERLARVGSADEEITTRVGISAWADVRTEALRAHATQVDPTSSWWFGLPQEVERTVHPFEDYTLARDLTPAGGLEAGVLEDDLFRGVV
jgi:mycothiol S-conjugate amidase